MQDQNQIELNGKVFRKAVVTVLCEDASTVIMQVENIKYL